MQHCKLATTFLFASLFTFLFTLTATNLRAQGETNNWFFGRATGLSFPGLVPLNSSAMNVWQGSTTVSDAAGNVLFYTDGQTVWNISNVAMTNGTGLLGDPSSTQSSIAVPKPGNSNLYFLFTVAKEGGANGLRYSVIDMTLGGGFGDVTTKNTLLKTPVCEKITVVPKCNGTDFWVIAHNWNSSQFLLYEVTAASAAPVLVAQQNIGMNHSGAIQNTQGYMKISPNGKKLALATNQANTVEVYDFNSTTGALSNLKTISGMNYSYGIEFSPNSRYLFVSNWYDVGGFGKKIYQFDLNTLPAAANAGNNVYIYNTNFTLGAIQLANNGKIYFTRGDAPTVGNQMTGNDTQVGVLNAPNTNGGAIVENAVGLGAKRANHGLPNFIPNLLIDKTIDFTFAGTCYGSTTDFTATYPVDADSVKYFFGDGFESNLPNASHFYPGTGNYTIKLKIYTGCRADSLSKPIVVTTCSTSACNSSTGCFNTTLIINGDFESGNTGFTSAFTPNNGTGVCTPGANCNGQFICANGYGIATSPTPCNPTWSNNIKDHTTGTGNMMLVDFPNAGSNNIWCQNVNLTAGAAYCFGAYYINLLPSGTNLPTPTFVYTQNGVTIGNSNTIPENEQWNFTGVQFNATVTGAATMCIKNQNSGGTGYDVGIDDIKLREILPGTPPTANQDFLNICNAAANGKVSVVANDVANAGMLNLASLRIMQQAPFSQGTAVANTATGEITFTPSATFNGPVAVQYQICNTGGCCANGTILVDRAPSQTPSVTIATNPPLPVCSNVNVTFTATPVNCGVAPAYQWTVAGANVGTNQATYTSNTVPNGAVVRCVVTPDASACAIGTASAQLTMQVGAATPVITGTGPGSSIICFGKSATITASGGVSYVWSTTETTAAITVSPTVSVTTYTVTATAASGCTGTTSTNVNVNMLPMPTIAGNFTICNGGFTTLTASGGNTYAWDNATTNPVRVVTPTTTTSYTVTVTSFTNCSATTSRTVTVNPLPPAAITPPPPSTICLGASLTLTATGGTSYAWAGGPATAANTVTPAAIGGTTYTVTVTDGNMCSLTQSRVVIVNALPIPSITPASPTICPGSSTTLTASGGTIYAWNNGANSANNPVTPAATTIYTVTVTNGNSCSATKSATVTVNANLSPTVSPTSPTICLGKSTSLTATGGNTYVWSSGENTPTVNKSPAATTTYTVTATAAGGCTGTASVTVSVNSLPIPSVPTVPPICFGGNTTLTASGAGAGGSYIWNNATPTNTNTVSPTLTTAYTVTVTDSNTCSATTSQTVTVNPLPTANIPTGNFNICKGSSTTLNATGGGVGGSYAWSSADITPAATVTPIATTAYTVTVTDSNTCTATTSRTVTVNAIPTVAITGNASICLGGNTTLTATGGGSYLWSTFANNNSITIAPLIDTDYTVTVTAPISGCTATASTTVAVKTVPTPAILAVPAATTVCSGTPTTFTASGGVSYIWNTGEVVDMITKNPAIIAATTYTYIVTVTAANGCTASLSATSTVNVTPTATITGPTAACANSPFTLTASGSDTYAWSSSESTAAITKVVNSASSVTYTVTVTTSATGCSATKSQTVSIGAQDFAGILLTQNPTGTLCAGQPATFGVTLQGATPANPAYQWYIQGVPQTGATAATFTTSALVNADGLACIITTTGACPNTANDVIYVITQPSVTPTIVVSPDANNVCAGRQINYTTAITNGGSNPTYDWYVNNVLQPPTTAGIFNSTPANNDIIKCVLTSNATCAINPAKDSVKMLVTPNTPMSLSITSNRDTICAGAPVIFTVTAVGAGAGATYQWLRNGTAVGLNANTYTPIPAYVAGDIIDCTVTSVQVCRNPSPITVLAPNVVVVPIAPLTLTLSPKPASVCAGQAITFTATTTTGGTIAPTYQWQVNGSTQATALTNTFTSSTLLNNAIVRVRVTSNERCPSAPFLIDQVTVKVLPIVIPTVRLVTLQNPACFGDNVTITADTTKAGVAPVYNWVINNTAIANNTNVLNTNTLPSGNNFIKVSMNSSAVCAANPVKDSITVVVNPILVPAATLSVAKPTLCVGDTANLTLTLQDAGFSPTISWRKNGILVASNVFALANSPINDGDIFTVDVTSNDRCARPTTATSNSIVMRVQTINVAATAIGLDTCGRGKGIAVAVANSNIVGSGYTYKWSNQELTDTARGLIALTQNGTVYTVIATDIASSCSASGTVRIDVVGGFRITKVETTPALCVPAPYLGTAAPSLTRTGVAPFRYGWIDENNIFVGGATDSSQLLAPGNYTVSVTDAWGCTATRTCVVQPPLFPDIRIDPPAATIKLGAQVQLRAVQGAYEVLTYEWTPVTGLSCITCVDPVATPLRTTEYSVLVKNFTGCVAWATVRIEVVDDREVYIPNIFTPNDDGSNDRFTVFSGANVRKIKVMNVFDRWGEQVFGGKDFPINDARYGWDGTFKGTKMRPQVFVYYIEVEFEDGVTKVLQGDLTLFE